MKKELILILLSFVLFTVGCSKSEKKEDVKEKEMQKKIEDSFDESSRILNDYTRKAVENMERAKTNENNRPQIQ